MKLKKMMKYLDRKSLNQKICCGLLSLGLCSTSVLGDYTGGITYYDDYAKLNSGHIMDTWAATYGREGLEHGLIADSFPLDLREDMTREQFATLLVLVYETFSGLWAPTSHQVAFTDTDSEYVKRAYGLGLVSGYSDTIFGANDPVTREAATVMVGKLSEKLNYFAFSMPVTLHEIYYSKRIPSALKVQLLQFLYYFEHDSGMEEMLPDYTYESAYLYIPVIYENLRVTNEHRYADHGDISSWAMDSVYLAYDLELMRGDDSNHFNPKSSIDIQSSLVFALNMIGGEYG